MTYPDQPVPPQQPVGFPNSYPPQPPKKNNTLKILLIVAGVVVLLCCGGGAVFLIAGGKAVDKAAKELATPSAEPATTAAAPAGQAKPAGKTNAKQGQPARDGKFEFVVTGVDYGKSQVGDQYLNKQAQGQFVLVAVTVKNIGSDARTFDGSSQKAFGAGGVKYQHDGTAEIYANKDAATFLNPINPGNQAAGTLVFDIPKNAKLTGVELHDSPFSGGVTVDLT